jgi:hypothetical protein
MIEAAKFNWRDDEAYHKFINETYAESVNSTKSLKGLRDWVEETKWGFGERSFYWMWNIIVREMPDIFTFMEIGVFRGQVLALIKILANMYKKQVNIIGLSPMTSEGGYWESDYVKDVETIFDKFNLEKDYKIIKQLSNSQEAQYIGKGIRSDILYIDGGHTYDVVTADIINYTPCIKHGGYLVMDDCANKFNLPDGYFRGHEEVSNAVDEALPPFTENKNFEHYFNVVHNRVWKKL